MNRSGLAVVAALACGAPAAAQDYPTRPIRVLTTTIAGGISDIFMRALGEDLRLRLRLPLARVMEKLKQEKGADWVRVPFKGGGGAVNAILSGSTPIALIGEGNVIGHIRAGAMTALVMVNNIKSPNFPDVPTLAETGYA